MEYCYDCSRHPRSFDSGMALLNYNQAARDSMAAIKYKNKREYLDFYAAAMATRMTRRVRSWHADVLVPVPIHPARRRSRGYNQAEELARRLSGYWKIPVDSRLLVRTKKTTPQRTLNPSERLKNLQEAFAIDPGRGAGKGKQGKQGKQEKQGEQGAAAIPERVILVDDIYTTGSTIEACTRVLKAAGVRQVYFVAICIGQGR